MANTPNKNLNVPVHGSFVDDWDVPVNENWNGLDEALGGVTALSVTSVTGIVALTATQYTPPNLVITGALTGNVNYQLPAVVGGIWSIYNNTTASRNTVSFSSAAGGPAIVLPQGARTFVVADGTAAGVELAADLSPPATLNATTLGGVPAASYGRLDIRSTFNLVSLTRGQTINVSSGNYNTSAQQLQPTAVATPNAQNVGDGTFGTINIADPAIPGNYALLMTSATAFTLFDPTGATVGSGATGSPFSVSGIGFTLTVGGIAFQAGDNFTIAALIYGSNYFPVNMTVNGTLTNPTDLPSSAVQGFTWRIKQDATGGRTLAYGGMFKFLGSVAPTLSTAANAVDILTAIYDPVDNLLYCTFAPNFG